MRALIVDGANVVGSTPDGWWHDRAGAARRLHGRLAAADIGFDDVVLVLEGDAKAGVSAGGDANVRVLHAPRSGDDAIVDEARRQHDVGDDREVVVVTADRGLRDRLADVGAQTRGPRWLLDQL
jgi:hypothetical protein